MFLKAGISHSFIHSCIRPSVRAQFFQDKRDVRGSRGETHGGGTRSKTNGRDKEQRTYNKAVTRQERKTSRYPNMRKASANAEVLF